MSKKIRNNKIRKTSIVMNSLGTISLVMSLIVAFFPQGGALALAPGGSGAIWTTLNSCGTEQQDTNHYALGDAVYINGSGFSPGTSYKWDISGQPGGASGDPGIVVSSGTVTPDANGDGSFCFNAYTVLFDDWGTYAVKVGSKGDNYRVPGTDPGSIAIDKAADPTSLPETGGDVTFTITVSNTDAAISFTLDSLTDDVFGNLDNVGTCSVPQSITPLSDYVCSFTTTLSGDSSVDHVNTVTGSGTDAGGFSLSANDSATVGFTSVEPSIEVVKTASPTTISEAGENVTFSITVTNTGSEDLTLTSLVDDVFGDLNGEGTCSVPQNLLPLADYTCSFTQFISGEVGVPHVNTVTATGEDDDNEVVSDDDDASVAFTDVLPSISVIKNASAASIVAPGANVTFTVTITNQTPETVVIDSLVDSDFGNLNGVGTCSVPKILEATGESGDSYTCNFTGYIGGAAGAVHNNIVTANGTDSEQNEVSGQDDATVQIRGGDTPPPFIPVTGADLQSGFPLSSWSFASIGLVFFGLSILTKGYADRRESQETIQ